MIRSLGALGVILFLAGCQSAQPPAPESEAFNCLVQAHARYGATPQDWPKHEFQTERIQPDVIVAPLYGPEFLAPYVRRIEVVAEGRFPVFEIETKDGARLSFIRTGVGACNMANAVLALAGTVCRRILFVGSVGSLTPEVGIGDLIVPEVSVCGCGADAYLTEGSFLKASPLGQAYAADAESVQRLRRLAKRLSKGVVGAQRVFSIDTLLGEYPHLPEIQSLGCQAIEMETATLFHAAQITGRQAAALLYVSDCTLQGQSFYHGRTKALKAKKAHMKKEILPQIILQFFQ